MATLQANRISATLSQADMQEIKAAFATLYSKMPFLTGLTTDERVSLPKINDSNKTFTEDAIAGANNNTHFLPGYFSATEMENDLSLFKSLDEIYLLSNQLTEKVDDTRMLVGSEAYVGALTFYRLVEAASKGGIPGADAVYTLLKERFADQGNNGPAPAPEPPVQ